MAIFIQASAVFLMITLINCGASIKVVLLPSFGTSHLLVMDAIGAELQNRGHEVIL